MHRDELAFVLVGVLGVWILSTQALLALLLAGTALFMVVTLALLEPSEWSSAGAVGRGRRQHVGGYRHAGRGARSAAAWRAEQAGQCGAEAVLSTKRPRGGVARSPQGLEEDGPVVHPAHLF